MSSQAVRAATGTTALNLNTAAPELIALYFPELSASSIDSLRQQTKRFHYRQEFMDKLPDDLKETLNKNAERRQQLERALDTGSRYFLLTLEVHYGRVLWHEQALIERSASKASTLMRVRLD